jgi:hypothetical protein|tara:strand:- start:188 stop:406 length:219 start_codon:yes stop_codon:yes gene_type:complete
MLKSKEHILYDINTDKFMYLKRKENRVLHKVDINELNKKLNASNRSSFYNTALIVFLCLSCLIILSLISINF